MPVRLPYRNAMDCRFPRKVRNDIRRISPALYARENNQSIEAFLELAPPLLYPLRGMWGKDGSAAGCLAVLEVRSMKQGLLLLAGTMLVTAVCYFIFRALGIANLS
jgi:hypothetical protein